MHPLQWLRARRRTISVVTLVALIATPVTIAVLYKGFPISDVELTARDVWVTNSNQQLAGRLNMQIKELNGATNIAGIDFDVMQNGEDVFVLNRDSSVVERVDPAYTTLGQSITVPA